MSNVESRTPEPKRRRKTQPAVTTRVDSARDALLSEHSRLVAIEKRSEAWGRDSSAQGFISSAFKVYMLQSNRFPDLKDSQFATKSRAGI